MSRKNAMQGYFRSEVAKHMEVAGLLQETVIESLAGLVEVAAAALREGRKILFFGNGGSAADAQHIATEFVVRFNADRNPLAALALSTDTSTLTAVGNDYGFEGIFERQVQALCRKGDIAVGISTSGKSPNVIRGLQKANDLGAVSVALTGCDGGDIAKIADHVILVPSNSTARIQEMHILIGHMLVGAMEQEFLDEMC